MTNWMSGSATVKDLKRETLMRPKGSPRTKADRVIPQGMVHAVDPDTRLTACPAGTMKLSDVAWPPRNPAIERCPMCVEVTGIGEG